MESRKRGNYVLDNDSLVMDTWTVESLLRRVGFNPPSNVNGGLKPTLQKAGRLSPLINMPQFRLVRIERRAIEAAENHFFENLISS